MWPDKDDKKDGAVSEVLADKEDQKDGAVHEV